jgi:antitoxin component YwqK of YwqJK toxin-antitoxin module
VFIGFTACNNKSKKVECNNTYLFNNIFQSLDWKKNILNDNVIEFVGYNQEREKNLKIFVDNESDIIIFPLQKSMEEGFSYYYNNNKLVSITTYSCGKREGLNIYFNEKFIPEQIHIYNDDQAIGLVEFFKSGAMRGMSFNAKEFTNRKKKYSNGVKAYDELLENGIQYWAIYGFEGDILIKWPFDNDFCKAQFFENGKEVKIPYYFNQKEFEMIYTKIQKDVNKSTLNL